MCVRVYVHTHTLLEKNCSKDFSTNCLGLIVYVTDKLGRATSILYTDFFFVSPFVCACVCVCYLHRYNRGKGLIQIVSVGMSLAKENRQAAVFIAYTFFC